MAIQGEFPEGVRGSGLYLISDNGSQPTSTSFMRDMANLGIKQISTSYDNLKGNADTERVMRTIKEEVIWINKLGSFEEAMGKIAQWIDLDYNKLYVHSQLGYMSPSVLTYGSHYILSLAKNGKDAKNNLWGQKRKFRCSKQ